MKFFSWIPTVSGRLSYTQIGDSIFPSRVISYSEIGRSRKGVAIFVQKRFCDDFIIPAPSSWNSFRNFVIGGTYFLLNRKRLSGLHHFVCLVDALEEESAELDRLVGRVFPVVTLSKNEETSAKQVIAGITSKVENASRCSELLSAEESAALFQEIECSLSPHCLGVIEFKLSRNGIIELEGKPLGLAEGRSSDLVDDYLNEYVEQSFFFLRDISHTHQHHEPESDTIITVHSERDFKRRIYFDLFRYIIRFKRIRSSKNIMRAGGVLAYAKSFKSVANTESSLKSKKIPDDYQIENLQMSLEAARFQLEHDSQRRATTYSLALTILFGFFGLLLAMSALSQFGTTDERAIISPHAHLIFLTGYIAGQPYAAAFLLFFCLFVVLSTAGNLDLEKFSMVLNIQRLFAHLNRITKAVLLATIGFACIWIALDFVHESFGLFNPIVGPEESSFSHRFPKN